MEIEIWKDVKGFEGLYQVSNLGNVKSLERMVQGRVGMRICHERILIPILSKRGYYVVRLGRGKQKKIHRLVAIAFHPNPENKPLVNHKDGNKLNPRADNLEWSTYHENNLHAMRTGLNKTHMIGKFGKDSHISVKVAQYDKKGNFIQIHDSIREATASVGLKSKSLITMCAQKKKHH
jgi:hypothetical protein